LTPRQYQVKEKEIQDDEDEQSRLNPKPNQKSPLWCPVVKGKNLLFLFTQCMPYLRVIVVVFRRKGEG
jgi:hypothetical protein